MSKFFSHRVTAAVVSFAIVAALCAAPPAAAADDARPITEAVDGSGLAGKPVIADGARPVGIPFTEYTMVSRKLVSSTYTNLSNRLGVCKSSGGTCTISESEAATRTIGVALGATRGWAAGQLSISASWTRTLSISCTSPKLKSGQVWKAYPLGKCWSYKIQSQVMAWDGFGPAYPIGSASTSGTLYAFEPNGVDCRL